MPPHHDTVITDLQAEVRAFCEAVRGKLVENEERYPVEEARAGNQKAP